MSEPSDAEFVDAVEGLRSGDFSRLDPLFASGKIVEWCEAGLFDKEARAEALTCACFNGRVAVAEYLLQHGVDPSGGSGTGLNAIHWAANRGQLEAVRLLLRHKVPLETRSAYDGTALGTAMWASENEPKPEHAQIIQELVAAGAKKE
jgi:ankyrin repeat protein